MTVSGPLSNTQPNRRRATLAVVLALAVALGPVSACSTSEPRDPAVERQERVDGRLRETLSGRQADCVIDALDSATLVELDRTGPVDLDSPQLATWSEALRGCVTDSGSPVAPAGPETPGDTPETTTTEGP